MSNISEGKGAELLLEVCRIIVERSAPLKLTICGGVLDDLSQQVIDTIQKYTFVNYMGPVSDVEEKMQIYKEHDFLIFLSKENYEVYPLVYIEALMNGLSVITTQQVVAGEIIGNGRGLLLKKDNFVEYVMNNVDLLSLTKLKFENRKAYEVEYDFKTFCEQIKKIVFYEPQE
jgi:glycosyltransferase involved in cell wall biosynthesis